MTGGLIPLMLKTDLNGAGYRGGVVFSSHYNELGSSRPSDVPTLHRRKPLLSSAQTQRQKVNTEKPLSSKASLASPSHPRSSAAWREAVAEVKRQYANGKYRPCSERCCQILDNIEDSDVVEPAYLVYLHFYAASSIEMLAWPLSPSMPNRSKLLRQARHHYVRARSFIHAADELVSRSSRPSSAATVTCSLHSPSASVSSCASTEPSSPADSVCGFASAMPHRLKGSPTRRRKRVTFKDEIAHDGSTWPSNFIEPIIRPDSPTLGLDDFSSYRFPGEQDAESELHLMPPSVHDFPAPLFSGAISNRHEERRFHTQPFSTCPEAEEDQEDRRWKVEEQWTKEASPSTANAADVVLLRTPSTQRYCALLASLRSQAAIHMASIDAQLAMPTALLPSSTTSSASAATNEEMRSLDLRARIERLRANGWQRRRFDARRYEELREKVLAELS